MSPRGTPSDNTLRLLVEEGYRWCGDFPDDELPYVEEIDGKAICVIPYSGTAVNDYPVTINQGNTPRIYVEEFTRTVDILREEYELYGRPGWVRASVHAHVYGRSWGRWAFRDVIRYAKILSGCLDYATRGELGDHVLAQHAAGKRMEARKMKTYRQNLIPIALPNGAKVAMVSSIAMEMWSRGSSTGQEYAHLR